MTQIPAAPLVVALLAALAAVGASLVVASYRRFVRQRELVRGSWRQLEVELHRRYELARDLVTATQDLGLPGRATGDEVLALCGQARRRRTSDRSGLADLARLEAELAAGLRRLFGLLGEDGRAASRPGLADLRQRLIETEDRIAAGRLFYNANVAAYNSRVERLPARLVASRCRFLPAWPFDVAADQVRSLPAPL